MVAHQARIDELISTYAIGWSLDRMPSVDRAILRLGAYELLWSDDVPDAVVIDEAVDLASSLSTDDSPAFVNGLLARLLALKPTLVEHDLNECPRWDSNPQASRQWCLRPSAYASSDTGASAAQSLTAAYASSP